MSKGLTFEQYYFFFDTKIVLAKWQKAAKKMREKLKQLNHKKISDFFLFLNP